MNYAKDGATSVCGYAASCDPAQYTFRSPEIKGVVAGRDYKVELRIMDQVTGNTIATYRKSFHADINQDILPEVAPVVGPGYHTNPVLIANP